MSYSRQRIREVAAIKRAAVERIQTAIGQIDTSPSHKYIEEFNDEFDSFESICDPQELLLAASGSNLIWIGDYHALSRFQEFAAAFVVALYRRHSKIALAVEPVFARHQKILEKWTAGKISEQSFLDGIHYDEEWGCDWKSYGLIFRTARDLRIPIYGVDSYPRYGMRSILRRDSHTAQRIANLIETEPDRKLIVIFGESHLGSTHLPGQVRARLEQKGLRRKDLLILQNMDEIYWKLQARGLERTPCVRLSENKYCVFNATPIEKYESFRQYLRSCLQEDPSGTWTDFVHSLINITMEFVDLKADEHIGKLPKVCSTISPNEFPQLLARLSVPATTAQFAVDLFQEYGTSYIPELNSIFIHRLQLTAAAEESTRFIHQACRGEIHKPAGRDAGDQFFVAIIERALGYFCSKLLDSSRDGIESLSKRVLSQIGYNDQLARAVSSLLNPVRRPAGQQIEALRSAIVAGNRSGRTRHMLGQLLGYGLGRQLYDAYLETRISRKDLQALFLNPLDRPLECYRDLTERLS